MPTNEDDTTEEVFQGYTSPNYTQVPDEFFDRQLSELSGAELKVLLYIMRRTFGFKKDADNISLNQICRGITTRDGRVLDRGTGLSKSTAQLAIKALLEKNIILTTKRFSRERGNEATTYELNVPSRRPYTENRHRGAMPEIGTALYRKSTPQETVQQQTDRDLSNFEGSHDDAMRDEGDDRRGRGTGQLMPLGEILQLRSSDNDVRSPEPAIVEPKDKPRQSERGDTVEESEERERLRPFLEDFARELGDQAPLSSTITRTLNIFREASVSPERWSDLLYQARGLTQEHTGQIRKVAGESSAGIRRKNKMPYFLATLEQLVGLRPAPTRQPRGSDRAS